MYKGSIIPMTTLTYAMKAQRLFRSMGYMCDVRRTSKASKEGCGYSIEINENATVAKGILDKNKIAYKQTSTE